MLIAVLADTHIPRRAKSLPEKLLTGIAGVDLIIHAGDIMRDYVIYELENIAPVEAVYGNNDDDYVREITEPKKVITAEECRIGIIHGDGAEGKTLERVIKAFADEEVQCVVYGHSHIPKSEIIDGVLYFNPGSPTDKRRQKQFSYGILKVSGRELEGEIRYF